MIANENKYNRHHIFPCVQLFLIIIFALLISGCDISIPVFLHPAYLKDSKIVNDEIVGQWERSGSEDEGRIELEISKPQEDAKIYKLTLLKNNKATRFEGVLFQVEDSLYFDLLPDMEPFFKGKDNRQLIFLIRSHTIAKVSIEKDALFIALIDIKELEKFIEQHPDYFHVEKAELHALILSPSEKIQDFLKLTSKNKKLFDQKRFLKKE
jgi:hypothetical protein